MSSPSTFFIFCFSCLVLILTYFIFGMYYEEGTDPYFITILSGALSAEPEHILNTYGFHFIISYFYKTLYTLNPTVPWYDFAIAILLALFLTFLIQILLRLLQNVSVNYLGVVGVAGFIVIYCLFFENFVLIQITRVAYLLSISSALLLFLDNEKMKMRKIILLNFCILLALLSRIEPVILSWAVLLPWVLIIHGFSKENFLRIIKSWGIFASLSFLISIGLNISFNQADKAYKEFRPYQFTLWDFEQPGIKLDLKNKNDSLIYLAAKKSFLTDRKNINPTFFKRIGLNPLDKSPLYALNFFKDTESRFQQLKKNFRNSANEYPFLLYSALFTFVCLSTWFVIARKPKILKFIFLLICFTALLLFLAGFMKMESRVFGPMIQIELFLLFCFFLLEKSTLEFKKGFTGVFFLLFFFLNILQATNFTLPKIISRTVNSEYIDSIKNEIAENFNAKIIWVNLYVMDRLFIPLFHSHTLPPTVKWASLDNAILCYYPSWEETMKRITNETEFPEIVSFLLNQPGENFFLSTLDRMKLLQSYCKEVHGIEFIFKEIPSKFNEIFAEKYPTYYPVYKIGVYQLNIH